SNQRVAAQHARRDGTRRSRVVVPVQLLGAFAGCVSVPGGSSSISNQEGSSAARSSRWSSTFPGGVVPGQSLGTVRGLRLGPGGASPISNQEGSSAARSSRWSSTFPGGGPESAPRSVRGLRLGAGRFEFHLEPGGRRAGRAA